MKKDIKDIFVLFLITVVAGCLLGFVITEMLLLL